MIITTADQFTIGSVTLGQTDTAGVEWYWLDVDGLGATKSTANPTQRLRGDGAFASEAFLQYRTVSVHGALLAPTAALLEAAMDQLNAAATIRQQQLAVKYADGSSRYLFGQRQDEVGWKRESDVHATFALQFLCLDPRKFAPAVTVSTALPSVTGGLTYSVTYPRIYTAVQVTGVLTIDNPGNATGKVTMRIDGPCTGPIITHLSTGLALTFASSLALNAGEWLDIDMEAKTVLANGQSSRSGYVTSRGWFGLDPGSNQFAFNASVYNAASLLTVTGTPAYL